MSCQVLRQFVDMSSNSSSRKTSRTSRQQVQQQQDPTAQLGFDYNAVAFDVPATTAAAASYDMAPGYSYDTFGATPDMSLYMPNAMTTAQVDWPSIDAAAYTSPEQQQAVAYSSPEQQSAFVETASFSETSSPQPQIENATAGSKPKSRKRPNRYKNAHPIVKERRREQNREAQRKYRERKDQRIVELEELLKKAQKQNETLSQAYLDLQLEHQYLLRQTTNSPSEVTDEDPGEGSSGANR